jgi:hypothetical protein
MIIASAITEWIMPAVFVIAGIAFYAGLGWVILKFYRWYRKRAEMALQRAYAGLEPHWPVGDGEVTLHFHTYYGLFVFFTQIEHQVALPADEARKLLNRLNRYNLVWGLLCPLVVVVPLLSLLHYYGQMRSLSRQEKQLSA